MILVLRCTLRYKSKQGAFAAPIGEARLIRSAIEVSADFFFFAVLHLLAEYELQQQ
jgi:hypothetical protein